MLHNTDAHITTWVITLILFIVALFLHNSKNEKGFKIVHMVIRLFYILIIITGGLLFFNNQSLNPALYGVKMLVGLLVIAVMEMLLIRLKKGKGTGLFWVLFIILLLAVFYLGLRLPLGWHPFA
ncbi:YisL family protein [Heyndrickxia acidicola]|uniref:UPF0344 protein P4T90_05180 n=1 Tax=Heyndrickxia acidicola TaxID=209389 RepID=A0ABU6MHF5_9BACI|nr:YisL family protein [Heyndrickxia acidicola]MED1202485.1 YisL family protein [Heyndrickxia acidicola]